MTEREQIYARDDQPRGPVLDRIVKQIRERINNGSLTGWLPSMGEFGREYGASRVTMGKALKILQQEGLVYIRQGAGTFVASSFESGTIPERIRGLEVHASESISSNLEILEPTPLENLVNGLKSYVAAKKRRAEIALSQEPSQENQVRLIEFAGQLEVLNILGLAVNRNPENSLLVAGIANLFEREINTINQYPSFDDAIGDI